MRMAGALKGESGTVFDIEVERDGLWVVMRVLFAPIRGATGGVELGIAVFDDLIRERAVERQLAMDATHLARSNVELEQFAYIASHDLSEPLRSVAGFVQLLDQRYGGRLGTEADALIALALGG